MAHEHIVASGIYYFESENIGDESALQFQAAIETLEIDMQIEQNDHRGAEAMFGVSGETGPKQYLDSVKTFQGRCWVPPQQSGWSRDQEEEESSKAQQ